MRIASVIVAARAVAPWVSQCVASVATQRLPSGWRLQVLLGVDACRSTLMAAMQLPVPNLQVYYFPQHVGPYVIFNSLARLEPSDLLVRFDADDVMLDGYLMEQFNRLEPLSIPQIMQTWSIFVDPSLHPISARLADGSRTHPDGRRDGASDGQFLMTYPVLERLGAFRAWWCHADSDFLRRAAWAGIRREIVPQYLYLRRMHPNSLSQAGATGYQSGWRSFYRQWMTAAESRYAQGQQAEWVGPAVAPHIRCATGFLACGAVGSTARWNR